jgi:hypothetical protein
MAVLQMIAKFPTFTQSNVLFSLFKTHHWTVVCLFAYGNVGFTEKNQLRSEAVRVLICLKCLLTVVRTGRSKTKHFVFRFSYSIMPYSGF